MNKTDLPDDYPKPGALKERFITDGKYSYFSRLDDYTELSMTPFGKMKLSVIPEGVIYSTYNYFKTQSKFPLYEAFFDSCIQHTKTADIDMKPRWRKFYDACQLNAIDTKSSPSLAKTRTVDIPQFSPEEIEESFWRVEKYKVSPAGIAPMERLGDPQNPYRRQMMEFASRPDGSGQHQELFALYLKAYPQTNRAIEEAQSFDPLQKSLRNEDEYIPYREALWAYSFS